MSFTKYQPYNVVLIVARNDEDCGTHLDALITLLMGAPIDCPLKLLCAVDPGHTARYPRPKVRIYGHGMFSVEFLVPEPETTETVMQKLVPLFMKNGWGPVGVRNVPNG